MAGLKPRRPRSIDVAPVTLRLVHFGYIGCCGFGSHSTLFRHDLLEGGINVLGHAFCIATNIEMRAVLEPCPDFAGLFEHSVLNVAFVGLIAREGRVEARESSINQILVDLILVEEIMRAPLIAEEEP